MGLKAAEEIKTTKRTVCCMLSGGLLRVVNLLSPFALKAVCTVSGEIASFIIVMLYGTVKSTPNAIPALGASKPGFVLRASTGKS